MSVAEFHVSSHEASAVTPLDGIACNIFLLLGFSVLYSCYHCKLHHFWTTVDRAFLLVAWGSVYIEECNSNTAVIWGLCRKTAVIMSDVKVVGLWINFALLGILWHAWDLPHQTRCLTSLLETACMSNPYPPRNCLPTWPGSNPRSRALKADMLPVKPTRWLEECNEAVSFHVSLVDNFIVHVF